MAFDVNPEARAAARPPPVLPPLGGRAGGSPALQDGDAPGRPAAIARHRSGAQPLEDGVGMSAYVVVGEEVERETHRVAVPLAEQRLDVLCKGELLIWPGERDLRLGFGLDGGVRA